MKSSVEVVEIEQQAVYSIQNFGRQIRWCLPFLNVMVGNPRVLLPALVVFDLDFTLVCSQARTLQATCQVLSLSVFSPVAPAEAAQRPTFHACGRWIRRRQELVRPAARALSR